MGEQIYSYQDRSFNLDQAYYYVLLIQVENDSFSFAVTYKSQLMAYGVNCDLSDLSELNDPQQLQELLNTNFKRVVIGLPAKDFSLVPNTIFDTAHVAGFARFLDVQPNEKVLAQILDSKNYVVYKISENLQAALSKHDLKNIVFAAKGWITAIADQNPLNDHLYLNIGNNKADFLCFKDGDICFYNSFDFKTPEDIVYYTALVTEELEKTTQDVNLIVSGNITADDKTYAQLAEFYANVTINKIQPVELPGEVAAQQILPLAGLLLCESLEVF